MDTIACTDSTETMRVPRIRRGRKAPVAAQTAIEKTPESELMTVEEYFDEVRQRCMEKYEKDAPTHSIHMRANSVSPQKKNRMSVEEYFGKLLKKLDEHYASVQES